ncbi:MAG: protein-glutamate O-methyltransferase CheR [Alphaproteobacteria bacterium]|nr:protein-glutamate O-methyltransferase CheR [Alphaproteobacteria bacterium]
MTPQDFDYIAAVLRQRSGLVIMPDKTYLLESRLVPLARRRGLGGLDQLIQRMRVVRDEKLTAEVVEAMTTNESFFFRDGKPFEIFRQQTLPSLIASRAQQRQIRIWSAACSTGQEPYSLAMILREEAARLAGWRIDILATDLSVEVLERAKLGLYTQFEVQRGLPIQFLLKYFAQVNDMWQIEPSVRSMVRFRQYNLLDDPTPLGGFDVIFCRNVLIYFDQPTKRLILDRMSQLIPPDGALYLGGAETVLGVSDSFKPLPGLRGVYGIAA